MLKTMLNPKVTASIPELGVVRSIRLSDVRYSESSGESITLDIPEYARPGDYDIKITISDDGIRKRTIYRPITIID